jgi:tryptophan synthase alpha chain
MCPCVRRVPEPMNAQMNPPMIATHTTPAGRIETTFRHRRDVEGRKLLVPFITGGMTDDWTECVLAAAASGADAIPFSDPIMDGPVIQAASVRALQGGATPLSVMAQVAALDVGVPVVAMTSYNIAYRAGHERYASLLAENGFAGTILPDLPPEEAGEWLQVADRHSIETIMLAAPTSSEQRLRTISGLSRGWVYGIGSLGVTGERASLAASASVIASRLKAVTDKPVLIGIGVSNAEQAAEVAAIADGVIVGTALVRRILDGAGPSGVEAFVGGLRSGLDACR